MSRSLVKIIKIKYYYSLIMQYNINNYVTDNTNNTNNNENNTENNRNLSIGLSMYSGKLFEENMDNTYNIDNIDNIDNINSIDNILNKNILTNDFELELNNISLVNNIDNFILKKKKLIEISKNLSKIEYFEIFNIIKKDNCQYSENKNGVFINLSNVSEKTIDKIFKFIDFIKHKKEDLDKHEEIISYTKKNIIDTNKSVEIIINKNNDSSEKNLEISDSEPEDIIKSSNYLIFSSDEEEDIENKLSLKKKKIKYTGKKAKMIKSIRDSNDINKNKNRNKKTNE
jgi:hypothetical protein